MGQRTVTNKRHILEMYERGYNIRRIAAELHHGEQTVKKVLLSNGVTLRGKSFTTTPAEKPSFVGGLTTVERIAKATQEGNLFRSLAKECDDILKIEIHTARKENVTWNEIAAAVGKSPQWLSNQYQKEVQSSNCGDPP